MPEMGCGFEFTNTMKALATFMRKMRYAGRRQARMFPALCLLLGALAVPATAAPTSLASLSWSNLVDADFDGYRRSVRLNWDADVAENVSTSVFEKVYYKRAATNTWTLLGTTSAHTITGTSTADVWYVSITCGSHDLYDWKLELYRVGQVSPDDMRSESNDASLNDCPMEALQEDQLPAGSIYISGTSWSDPADVDGDGYKRAVRLNWDADVAGGVSTSVFEKVYCKLAATNTWTLLATTASHPVTGASTSDVQYLDITGRSHGLYDWKLELYRVGQASPGFTRSGVNDAGLDDYAMELAAEDQLPTALAVAPESRAVGFGAGTTAFAVTNTDVGTMLYTAGGAPSWLSIVNGGSGTNSGTVTVAYETNPDAASRTGTVTVTAAGAAGSPKSVTVTQAPSPHPAVTVDNEDGPAGVAIQGAWSASVFSAGYYKTNYLHDQNADKGAKSVTFRPDLPANGMYAVAVWYPAQPINATNVPVDIVSVDGTNTAVVNQRVNGGMWFPIGTHTFFAGTNGCVAVRTAGTTNHVLADAVRFMWLGEAFGDQRATNNVPKWWLAQHGFTNFDADAMGDADGDGMPTWQEWVAGCNPTSSASVFEFTGTRQASPPGVVVRWSSISNRLYSLSRATNLLAGTNAFILLPGASNLPAMPAENTYTDMVQDAGPYYYRIDVHE
jgi:hypothetical protein